MDTISSDSGALRRGLRILLLLMEGGSNGLKVAEIADMTQLPRPTVYRLLSTLVDEQVVRRTEDGRRYTSALVPPERTQARWQVLARRAQPRMRRIASALGETVFLARQLDTEAVTMQVEYGDRPNQIRDVAIGSRRPLGVGAAGLALLAALPRAERERIVQGNASRLRTYNGMTTKAMNALVMATQERGYAVSADYSLRGVLGVGITLTDTTGLAIAAVSVGGPLERMSVARQREIATMLRSEWRASTERWFKRTQRPLGE